MMAGPVRRFVCTFPDGRVLRVGLSEDSRKAFSVSHTARTEVLCDDGLQCFLPSDIARLAREPERTAGLGGFVRGMLGGMADENERQYRLAACAECTVTDAAGERLYRLIGGRHYCGAPKLGKIMRNEKLGGCGCKIEFKTRFSNTT